MMRFIYILGACAFSYASAVNIYIQGPVTVIDCGSTEKFNITKNPGDQEEFYAAAFRGDLPYVESELSQIGTSGLNLDWRHPRADGETALHIAAYKDRPNVVLALLKAGANPNIQDEREGQTPLFIAARYNYLSVLRILLEPKYHVDVNLNKFHQTPVLIAAHEGHSTALELLLTQGGADPNIHSSWSPLQSASIQGDVDSVKALTEAGAHLNYSSHVELHYRTYSPEDYAIGSTALHLAAWQDHSDVALILLRAGADKNPKDNDGYTPADISRNHFDGSLARLIDNY